MRTSFNLHRDALSVDPNTRFHERRYISKNPESGLEPRSNCRRCLHLVDEAASTADNLHMYGDRAVLTARSRRALQTDPFHYPRGLSSAAQLVISPAQIAGKFARSRPVARVAMSGAVRSAVRGLLLRIR